jgi:hypothetical protein
MAEAIAPPTEEKMPTVDGYGLKAPTNSLGWETPPALAAQNAVIDKEHNQEFQPKIATIYKAANPNATPQDHVAAADALKAFSGPKNNEDFAGSHDIRWEDVFSAPNIGAAITAFTGGSDRREIGRNGDGTPVVTVYNARGDVRRYEWANGQRVTPDELKALGPVTSVRDISAERAAEYRARGLSAMDVAAAQSKSWTNKLVAAEELTKIAPSAVDVNNQIKRLSKDLLPYSTNPATRTIMARIGTLTANKEQQASIARQQLNRFANGEAENDEFSNYNRENGGVMGTFTYQKGKGLSTENGKKVTSENINELSSRIAATNSSAEKIQSNAQNLANWAQMIATQNKLPIVDKIQELIGLKTQASLMDKKIEALGGIPGFKGSPNLEHNVTDSFSLAYTNAEYGAAQAAAAQAYADSVLQAKQALGFKTPPMGSLEAQFANSPLATELRKQRTKGVENFQTESAPILQQLSNQAAYPEVVKEIKGTMVVPPKLPKMEEQSAIPGAKPPAAKVAAEPKQDTKKILDSIFGGAKK